MNTFEQVDAHVEEHFDAKAQAKAVKQKKIADIYKVARPVLAALASFPFVPKKWKQTITDLISVLDLITMEQE